MAVTEVAIVNSRRTYKARLLNNWMQLMRPDVYAKIEEEVDKKYPLAQRDIKKVDLPDSLKQLK